MQITIRILLYHNLLDCDTPNNTPKQSDCGSDFLIAISSSVGSFSHRAPSLVQISIHFLLYHNLLDCDTPSKTPKQSDCGSDFLIAIFPSVEAISPSRLPHSCKYPSNFSCTTIRQIVIAPNTLNFFMSKYLPPSFIKIQTQHLQI